MLIISGKDIVFTCTSFALTQACRARGMVVIFDEVMTGGFRLGAPTAASLLGMQPDIACFAKVSGMRYCHAFCLSKQYELYCLLSQSEGLELGIQQDIACMPK